MKINLFRFPWSFPLIAPSKNPWWVEIRTASPLCTYYFGPFESSAEAELSQNGYIEDLVLEKAQGISVKVKRCCPQQLTVPEEFEEY